MWAVLNGTKFIAEHDGVVIYEDDDILRFEKLTDNILVLQRASYITVLAPLFVFDLQSVIYWKIFQDHLFAVRDTNGLISCAVYDKDLVHVETWHYIGGAWCVIYSPLKAWFFPFYLTGWNEKYTTGVIKNMPHKLYRKNLTKPIKVKERELLYNLDEIFIDDYENL